MAASLPHCTPYASLTMPGVQAHVLQHPGFTQLVELVLSIQRVGALPSKQQELEVRHRQVRVWLCGVLVTS